MDPVTAIVWIGVVVFAATSILALVYLAGFAPKLREEYGRHLFRILVAEVVVASVAVFTYYINKNVRSDSDIHMPARDLMIIEQSDTPRVVHDGALAVYIRSTDVSRARRVTTLQIDTRQDFSTSLELSVESGVPMSAELGGKKYRVSYSRMGMVDPNPKEKQGKGMDFILLTFEKIN